MSERIATSGGPESTDLPAEEEVRAARRTQGKTAEKEYNYRHGGLDQEGEWKKVPPSGDTVVAREKAAALFRFRLAEQESLEIRVRQ